MGTLLLLLLGGAAAAAGAWAALSRRDEEEKPPFFDLDERMRGGPKSSPGLPEGGHEGETGGRGRPVVISRGAARELKNALAKGPVEVEATAAVGPDRTSAEGAAERKKRRPLRLPHSTDDTIGRASRHAHHRRALQNAESLVERGKAEEAKAIFERAKKRVDDPEVQRKLQENIDAIDRWIEGVDQDEGDDNDFIRFPQIVIPLSTQSIALENLTDGLRRVSESLVGQVNEAAARLTSSAMGSAPMGAPAILPVAVPSGAPGPGAHVGAGAGTSAAPIVATAPITATAPVNITGPVTIVSGTPAFSPAGTAGYEEGLRMKVPAPHPGDGELLTGTIDMEWTDSFRQVARQGGPKDEPLPPGMALDDNGEVMTDGWTDADFERMWEKYRNLPLKDRRSGLDRRVHVDRRGDKRKDRRSGVERRKNDLFKEREEFLKKLAEHKKRKKDHGDWKKRNEERKDRTKKADLKAKAEAARPGEPQIVIQHANVQIGDVEGLEPKKPEPAPAPAAATPPAEAEKKPEPSKPEEPAEMLVRQAPPELDEINFPEAEEVRFEPESKDGGPGEAPELAGVAPEPEVEPPEPEDKPGEGVESFSSVAPLDDEFENDFEPRAEDEAPQGPVQEIRGVLELKPPEEDDAPFLTLTYDFSKIPDSFQLSRDYNTMEYAYYKYKPMLLKAQEFTRRKMLKNALNYYRVIKSQAVPPEMKRMINRNIQDITEYLEKFLMSRG